MKDIHALDQTSIGVAIALPEMLRSRRTFTLSTRPVPTVSMSSPEETDCLP